MLKILRAEGGAGEPHPAMLLNGRSVNAMARAGVATFFCVHYGIFWFVHGVFVLALPAFGAIGGSSDIVDGMKPAAILVALVALVALVISHGVSFWFNYLGHGEYRTANPMTQMYVPYGRLVVLHVTIIVGAIAISFFGAPAIVVAILVGLKTLLDLGFHLAEHRARAGALTTD